MDNSSPASSPQLWNQKICRICFKQFENEEERNCHERRGHIPRAEQSGAHNYLFQCSYCKTEYGNMIQRHSCEMRHFFGSIQRGETVCHFIIIILLF